MWFDLRRWWNYMRGWKLYGWKGHISGLYNDRLRISIELSGEADCTGDQLVSYHQEIKTKIDDLVKELTEKHKVDFYRKPGVVQVHVN